MSGAVLAAAFAITFASATCQSLTGFGFALVMVPLLSLAWDVKSAVVASTLLGTIILLPLLWEARRHVRLGMVAPLLTGSLAGVPAGVILLDLIDPEALKILVGAVVIAASLALYLALPMRWAGGGTAASLAVGAVSGALRASTSMGGPPAVLYLLGSKRDLDTFRGTLLAFFLPVSLLALAGLAGAGRVTPDVLRAAAVGLPALAAGLAAGGWLRSRVPEGLFRSLVLALLVTSSAAVIASAAASLT